MSAFCPLFLCEKAPFLIAEERLWRMLRFRVTPGMTAEFEGRFSLLNWKSGAFGA